MKDGEEPTEIEGWAEECLAMIAETLTAFGCRHEDAHGSTPPMMYPEWITCALAKREATIEAQAREIAILRDGRCVSCMEPVNPLHPQCACTRAEIDELKGTLERTERALGDSRTYTASMVITDAQKLSAKPDIVALTEKKLRDSLIRQGCCQFSFSDWLYEEPYEYEGESLGGRWRRNATGEECETALYWKEKADYALARLQELADIRADQAKEGSPYPDVEASHG